MAARANPFFDATAPTVEQPEPAPYNAVAKLAQMHAEAVETARLANLLGRSLSVAIALPILAALAMALGGAASLAATVSWGILVAVASLSVLRAHGNAIHQPFERAALHAFAQDLSACLLYAGFAWGAGAFLVLASMAPAGAALLFAAVPAAAIAMLLRERAAVLLFVAPVAALTSFACVLRPFAGGALGAGLVLIGCAVVAGAMIAASRHAARRREADGPHGLFAA